MTVTDGVVAKDSYRDTAGTVTDGVVVGHRGTAVSVTDGVVVGHRGTAVSVTDGVVVRDRGTAVTVVLNLHKALSAHKTERFK